MSAQDDRGNDTQPAAAGVQVHPADPSSALHLMREVLLKQIELLVESVRHGLGTPELRRNPEAAEKLWEETRETRRLFLETMERMDERSQANRKEFMELLDRVFRVVDDSRRLDKEEERRDAAQAADGQMNAQQLVLQTLQKMDDRAQESRKEFLGVLERMAQMIESRPPVVATPAPRDELADRRMQDDTQQTRRLVIDMMNKMDQRTVEVRQEFATILEKVLAMVPVPRPAVQPVGSPVRYGGLGIPDPRLASLHSTGPETAEPNVASVLTMPQGPPRIPLEPSRDFAAEAFVSGQRYENLRFHVIRAMSEASLYKSVLIAPALEKALQVVIDDIPEHNSGYLDRIFHTPPASYKKGFKLNHCLNVGVLSAILGHELGLSRWELFELALGGLFHDIGMLDRRWAFVLEPRTLRGPERKLLRVHPMEAPPFFRNVEKEFPLLPVIAAQHHEREDGSGYPYATRGEEIHPWSKIIGLADEMEALARPRPQRAARPILDFFGSRNEATGARFAPALWKVAFRCVTLYPPGSRVLLSSGSQATVVRVNPEEPLRPVVRVEAGARPGAQAKYLDLRASPQLRILQLAA